MSQPYRSYRTRKASQGLSFGSLVLIAACILICLGLLSKSESPEDGIPTPRPVLRSTLRMATATPMLPMRVAVILADVLNLHQGPGIGYAIAASEPKGSQFPIVGANDAGTWLALSLGVGQYGWVTTNPNYIAVRDVYVDAQAFQSWQTEVALFEQSYKEPTTLQSSGIQPTPAQEAVCVCSHNAYNCPNFSSRAAAQACFDYCRNLVGYDVHQLDADNDGRACESNP